MVVIEHSGRMLTEHDVIKIEDRLGVRFPAPYRRFLLKHNGGRPTPDTIDVEGLPGNSTDIHSIFGTDETDEVAGLGWYVSTYAGRLSGDLLPIARDSGGNLFCLSLSRSDFGSVVYCDFDPTFHLGGATYYRVAADFDSFLERIRSFEDN